MLWCTLHSLSYFTV